MAIKTAPPEFRKIMSCYEYSGCFSDSPEATIVFNCLLGSVKSGTKSAILSHLQRFRIDSNTEPRSPHHQQSEIDDRVCRTAISTIYIKKAYPTFEGVWQLIIHKAEAWVDSVVHGPQIWTELERIYVANWIGSEVHEDNSLKVDEDLLLEAYNSTNLPSDPSSVPDIISHHEDRRSLQKAPEHEPTANLHSKPQTRHKSRRKEVSSNLAKRRGDRLPQPPIPAGYRSRSRSRSPHQDVTYHDIDVNLSGKSSPHLYQSRSRRSDFAETSPTTFASATARDPIELRLPPLPIGEASVLDQPYSPEPPTSSQIDPWQFSSDVDVSQSNSTVHPTLPASNSSSYPQAYNPWYPETSNMTIEDPQQSPLSYPQESTESVSQPFGAAYPTSPEYYPSSVAQAYEPTSSNDRQRETRRRSSVSDRPQSSRHVSRPYTTAVRTSPTTSSSRTQAYSSGSSSRTQREGSRRDSAMARPQILGPVSEGYSTNAQTSYTSYSASRDQQQRSSASQAYQWEQRQQAERQRMAYQ